MEDIFTNSQVPRYSLNYFIRKFVFSLTLLLHLCLYGQEKKAIKLVEKSDIAVRERRFIEAKELLLKAINKDPSYGEPYLKLAGIYNVYRHEDSALIVYNLYVQNVASSEVKENIWQRIAQLNYQSGNYQKAKEALDHTSTTDDFLRQSIEFSIKSVEKGVELKIEPLPESINQYPMQYFPALTVDENIIIYTKLDPGARVPNEDIMISTKINGEWIPAQSLSKDVNTPYNEGAATISADGNTLIFTSCEGRPSFGSCDLYITYRQGNKWAEPENLGSRVNTQYWDSQPALTSDGRTLYFASNRPGGHGLRDLYVTHYDGLYWSKPENLGDGINTKGDETTPFIHANSTLLFFSSNGHPGLGKLDLYLADLGESGWSKVENLGYPINTKNDELSLFVNATGTTAYYAQEEQSRTKSTIVKFKLPTDSLVKRKASYVTGRVLDESTNVPVGASFRMVNLNDTSDVFKVRADSVTGKYFLVLTSGKEYSVFVSKAGYLFEDFNFKAKENTLLEPDTIDIYLQAIQSGQSITLENIYFDFDDYILDKKSLAELDDIIGFIEANPELIFKIEGHTDNSGDPDYNMKLSRNRARSVYDYLVKNGISSKRLSYEGFGDTKPAYTNKTESGKRKNRRITFSMFSGL